MRGALAVRGPAHRQDKNFRASIFLAVIGYADFQKLQQPEHQNSKLHNSILSAAPIIGPSLMPTEFVVQLVQYTLPLTER